MLTSQLTIVSRVSRNGKAHPAGIRVLAERLEKFILSHSFAQNFAFVASSGNSSVSYTNPLLNHCIVLLTGKKGAGRRAIDIGLIEKGLVMVFHWGVGDPAFVTMNPKKPC